MLTFLRGILRHKGEDPQHEGGVFVLEVHGLGFELLTSTRALATPGLVLGEEVFLYAHMIVRQDAMLLVGFPTRPERDLFLHLQSAGGVGLKVALAILSALSVPEIVQAILSGNANPLTEARGVGKKLAQKVVLDLKDKMTRWQERMQLEGVSLDPAQAAVIPATEAAHEAESVLLSLGYSRQEILQSLEAAFQQAATAESATSEDLLQESLRWLARQ